MTQQTSLFKFTYHEDFSLEIVEALHNKKVSDNDVLVDEIGNYYIWPAWKLLTVANDEVHVDLKFTREHRDALDFFQPLRYAVLRAQKKFVIRVKKSDEGLSVMYGNLNFPCEYVEFRYHPQHGYRVLPLSATFRFSAHPKHSYCFDAAEHEKFMTTLRCGIVSKFVEKIYDKTMLPHISVLMKVKSDDKLFEGLMPVGDWSKKFGDCFYLKQLSKQLKLGEVVLKAEKYERFITVNGPIDVVRRKVKRLLEGPYEVCFESGLDEDICVYEIQHEIRLRSPLEMTVRNCEGKSVRSEYRHNTIIDICLALFFIDAPYSILDIVDAMPLISYANRVQKIRLVESVFQSMRKVVANRKPER